MSQSPSHTSNTWVFGTTFWVDPEEELIAIQMTQLMNFARYALPSQFRALVYPTLID